MSKDTLRQDSFEWALTHIARFGDTDIFPVPFEYAAIREQWNDARAALVARDLCGYRTEATRRVLMPKDGDTFRVATQLDPLDSLVYCAILHEIARPVEDTRVAEGMAVACAYRIDLQADGQVFKKSNGWPDFGERSKSLADSGAFSHVVVADIADFYNQAYHHRIENVLEGATIPRDRAKNIEEFLGSLTAQQSRGLPVGPTPSIVLAEACLDDVDKRLLAKGWLHARYVDDFRIFCRSKHEALVVLQDLTEYLYTAHRLTLQAHKTGILSVEEFRRRELQDPAEQEERAKVDAIQGLLDEIWATTGYSVTEEELAASDIAIRVMKNIAELFEQCLARSPLHLGVARYLLRRATHLRARALYPLVFAHMALLAPVFREVCLYIGRTVPSCECPKYGAMLLEFLRKNDYGRLAYTRMWGLDLLARKPALAAFAEAVKIAEDSERDLGIRPAALLAKAHRQVEWVRGLKEKWNSYGPWDRRAVVWAASALSEDERRAWVGTMTDSQDVLERSVARSVL